ncbi:MAG: DNA-binding protein [Fibrobacteria bacterium]|nr:DNA-binding protein [Fibrobacteria bacterium]
MKFSQADPGRIYIIRLEHGDILHECIERLVQKENVKAASLSFVGGVDKGSVLIIGPEDREASPVIPMELTLEDAYEATGTGTLFPNEKGEPVLHMHLACGREKQTITGCVRKGVKIWHVGELVLRELTNSTAIRKLDKTTGFALMEP